MRLLVKGGSVLTPSGVRSEDVLVESGRVAVVAPDLDPGDCDVLDATGCWVGPGLVDLHAHLREPGQEWKEDVGSGSEAAAAGGFTAVVAMPNTDPAVDSGHLARFVEDRGREAGVCDVVPAGSITLGRRGERLSHLDELWGAGVRIFTDDGDGVADAGLLRHAMEYLAGGPTGEGGVIAQHAEDPGLARGGHMHEGAVSSRLGIRGLPAAAEEVMVARDLTLVRLTGCRYHAQHVSTRYTVAMVARAKGEGLPVTAEVTPHHLSFDHESVATMDPAFKMYPPLRTPVDVAALREALLDGTIDAVATDHAPHASHECEVPFEEAPRGVIGLETAVPAVLAAVPLGQEEFFMRLSVSPARIAGLTGHGVPVAEGSPANLAVIDPRLEWTATGFRSRSENSPWRGRTLRGRARATILRGRITHRIEAPLHA